MGHWFQYLYFISSLSNTHIHIYKCVYIRIYYQNYLSLLVTQSCAKKLVVNWMQGCQRESEKICSMFRDNRGYELFGNILKCITEERDSCVIVRMSSSLNPSILHGAVKRATKPRNKKKDCGTLRQRNHYEIM